MKNGFGKLSMVSLAGVALALWGAAGAPLSRAASEATLTIETRGDGLAFDKTELAVDAGQRVELTFRNDSDPASGMQHNWVLVKPGTEQEVIAASMAAGPANGWLASSPDIIAHTRLLNGGESETIVFDAPSVPGDYPYFCSFPGHAMTMKGILHVQ